MQINQPIQLAYDIGFADARYTQYENSQTVLLVFLPYSPDINAPEPGTIKICGYYPTAMAAYKMAQQLIQTLVETGYEAKLFHKHGLKKMAAKVFGARGKNTLFYHPQFGSNFNMQGIVLNMPVELPNYTPPEDFCGDCTLCAQACPTGAIQNGRFTRHECIRNHTSEAEIPPQYGRHIYQMMGCELCQVCCPKNPAATGTAPAYSITEVLMGWHTKEIKKLIGANYGTRTRILNQAIYYAANTMYKPATPVLKELVYDPQVGYAAKYALSKMEGIQKKD